MHAPHIGDCCNRCGCGYHDAECRNHPTPAAAACSGAGFGGSQHAAAIIGLLEGRSSPTSGHASPARRREARTARRRHHPHPVHRRRPAGNSGHPGAPMGAAPMAYVLWTRFLHHAPTHPDWPDRDRFVLSAGHASMLLYSLLHLTGYDLPLDELKRFRQLGSRTPGHPEYGLTPGVEATTGPLGQGFANAVGMAIAERRLAAEFNRPGHDDRRPLDVRHLLRRRPPGGHRVRGGQPRRAPAAGQARFLYDDNRIQLDGPTVHGLERGRAGALRRLRLAHPARRGRQRPRRHRGGHQRGARRTPGPSLIAVRTHIGYGSPNQPARQKAHGSPLGPDEVRLTKEAYGWDPDQTFFMPDDGAGPLPRGRAARRGAAADVERALRGLRDGDPDARGRAAPAHRRRAARRLGRRPAGVRGWRRGVATRNASQRRLQALGGPCRSCSAAPPTCPRAT